MRAVPFLLLTASGSLIWNAALIWFGSAAGASWGMITKYMGIYSYITAAVLGIIVLALSAVLIKKRFLKEKDIPDTPESNI
jgi:membrane protein DedA with SNARE-associated domain